MKPKDSIQIIAVLKKVDHQTLLSLLSIYSEKILHNSNQLWAIGAVFIPLSLSGIAIGLNSLMQTILIGSFSIILIWIWYFISMNLRDAIDQTYKICGSIETVLLKFDPPRNNMGLYELIPSNRLKRLKVIRLFIPIIVTIGWLVVITISIIISL